MQRRYTLNTLQAGQPGPYKDTIYRHQIIFEFALIKDQWEPWDVDEKTALSHARHFSGWSDPIPGDDMANHFRTRLAYIKPIEPHIWEWETRSAYTD